MSVISRYLSDRTSIHLRNGIPDQTCFGGQSNGPNWIKRAGDSSESQVSRRSESLHHEECQGTCKGR